MSEQPSTWPAQGAARPHRFVPPLPQGVPIVPGEAKIRKRSRRWSVSMVILAVVFGLYGLGWLYTWCSNYDEERIDAVVRPAMFAHATFGTRLTATLWNGPRILLIGSSYVQGGVTPPTTCVGVYLYDPKTGAQDRSEFGGEYMDCIPGLAYEIPYPMARPVGSRK